MGEGQRTSSFGSPSYAYAFVIGQGRAMALQSLCCSTVRSAMRRCGTCSVRRLFLAIGSWCRTLEAMARATGHLRVITAWRARLMT
jgi:hypothetical protein